MVGTRASAGALSGSSRKTTWRLAIRPSRERSSWWLTLATCGTSIRRLLPAAPPPPAPPPPPRGGRGRGAGGGAPRGGGGGKPPGGNRALEGEEAVGPL